MQPPWMFDIKLGASVCNRLGFLISPCCATGAQHRFALYACTCASHCFALYARIALRFTHAPPVNIRIRVQDTRPVSPVARVDTFSLSRRLGECLV